MTAQFLFESRYGRAGYILVTTPAALLLGIVMGKALLPWTQAAAIFPLYFYTLSRGEWKQSFKLMAGWALLVAVLVVLLSFHQSEFMETRILYGATYKEEMFHWISTGIGPEGNIGQFLPQHTLHFLTFSLLTLASGGFLGLVMGSSLLNYMSFYVGALLIEAESIFGVLLLAWPPWALLRVAGFVLTAMVLSMLVFCRFRPSTSERQKMRLYALLALSFLLLDVVLKWRLADTWQQLLQRMTGL